MALLYDSLLLIVVYIFLFVLVWIIADLSDRVSKLEKTVEELNKKINPKQPQN